MRVGALAIPSLWSRADRRLVQGLSAVVIALVVAILLAVGNQGLAIYWLLGLGFGITFQRSRLCFASSFRDLWLMQDGRLMRAVLVGLALATVSFAVVMMTMVPNPSYGAMPLMAHVSPLGLHLVVGGLLFGFGMVIAGGCVSGSLYRVGEGYVGSWVAVAGMLVGLELANHSWNWWWQFSIGEGPILWLPNYLGYGGAAALALALLGGLYLVVLWWESKRPPMFPMAGEVVGMALTVGDQVRRTARQVFVKGWPYITGAAVLAGLNTLMFVYDHPLGVTGELSVWANRLAGLVNWEAPPFIGQVLSGCNLILAEASTWLTDFFLIDVGLIFGAFAAALGAGEFKLRFPPERRRYVQSLAGGVLMGYGATIAIGCTIGAFFSAIPSLGINGWIFGLSLLGGSYVGVKALRRLA